MQSLWMLQRCGVWCVLGHLLFCCGQGRLTEDPVQRSDQPLATVNGEPVFRADLEINEDAGLAAIRAALERTVDHELLAQQASARGVTSAELARRTRQLAVQELLRVAVESPNRPQDVSQAQLRERYAQNRNERFSRPERRASLHFLVRLPEDATEEQSASARRIAKEAWQSMRDEQSARALLSRNKTEEEGFSIIVENVPPSGPEASLDPAYRSALFETKGVGRVDKLVRSSFGWHAIWVTSVTPAMHVPFAEVESALREELSVELRRQALEALLEELQANADVVVQQERLREVLGKSLDLSEIEEDGTRP